MARKLVDPISKLEKEITKLQQQLMKAHDTKIAKLDKALISTRGKIKKAQVKLATLKGKKTPAASRQRAIAKESLDALKTGLQQLKSQFSDAKAELKKAKTLKKAEEVAPKANKPKKRKKVAKKTIKTEITKKKITPIIITLDLDKPVTKTKPKKSNTAAKKATRQKLKSASSDSERINDGSVPEVIHEKAEKAIITQAEESASPTEHLDNGIAQTDAASVSAQPKESKTAESMPKEPEPVKAEITDMKPEDTPKITNWHAIPIVTPHNND